MIHLSDDAKLCLVILLESGPQLFPIGQEQEAEECFCLGFVTKQPVRLRKSTNRYTGLQYTLTPEGTQRAQELLNAHTSATPYRGKEIS